MLWCQDLAAAPPLLPTPPCTFQHTCARITTAPTAHAGKFYELFEMDAHIAVEDLGLAYMKVGGC